MQNLNSSACRNRPKLHLVVTETVIGPLRSALCMSSGASYALLTQQLTSTGEALNFIFATAGIAMASWSVV